MSLQQESVIRKLISPSMSGWWLAGWVVHTTWNRWSCSRAVKAGRSWGVSMGHKGVPDAGPWAILPLPPLSISSLGISVLVALIAYLILPCIRTWIYFLTTSPHKKAGTPCSSVSTASSTLRRDSDTFWAHNAYLSGDWMLKETYVQMQGT